jgi:Ca2+-binding RTX toxin-like protein
VDKNNLSYNLMTLQRKSIPLFLMMIFTVMGALLGAASSHIVVIPSAFPQETDSSSSSADDNTQTNTNTQSFDLDFEQDVEAEVEQEAEQAAGNVALQDQEEDTTPPNLIVPEDIIVEATSADGAVVTFEVTAQDNVDGTATLDENNILSQDNDVGGDIIISCDPPSGTTFPIGETVVECTATDAAGNTATASFTVTVILAICEFGTATIVGTPGDDEITGTESRDVIVGLGGNDRIEGLGGDDLICGDEGNDIMFGGDGGDSMFGEAGFDRMNGGAGDDNMEGGAGFDRMNGGADDDFVDRFDGVVNNDNLDGGTGTDRCLSDPDPEVNCELD